MREALEGLPGVEKLEVDLADDRFDVRYDPRRASPDRMLETVRALGFSAVIVERPAGRKGPAVEAIDLAQLPQSLRDLFAQASRAGKPVLIDFSAPG